LLPLFVEEDETSLKFAMIKFEGQFACGYLSSEKYKYHLIRQSPFNAKEL
jgi:protein subunit release factor B